MLSEDKIFIGCLKEIKENIYSVQRINYFPIKLGIDINEGVLISKAEFPQMDEDKLMTMDCQLLYNQATNEVYYEYFEQPKTEEETLKERIVELEQVLSQAEYELMMGGLL